MANRHRAKFRRLGVDYSVGQYDTMAEKDAAIAGARQLLERIEAERLNKPSPSTKPSSSTSKAKSRPVRKSVRPLYSPEQSIHQLELDVAAGRYDSILKRVIVSLTARAKMIGQLPVQRTLTGYENPSKR